MEVKKPFLACDADMGKLKFPMLAMPKIDGVRGINLDGTLTGRSLKPHKNVALTHRYSNHFCKGFDGELTYGDATDPNGSLCRDTSSACSTIAGSPELHWWLFDYVTEETAHLPYIDRLVALAERVEDLRQYAEGAFLHVVGFEIVNNIEEINVLEQKYLDMGYEGVILRDPDAPHKNGKSTPKQAGYLRIKRFEDAEAIVVSIIEGQHNANDATINALGQTERSTHQANMIPNGMVGALMLRNDKGEEFKVSAGKMTHEERKHYFENQHLLLGATVKYKFFPIGQKDKPRLPTFQSIRVDSDIDKGE